MNTIARHSLSICAYFFLVCIKVHEAHAIAFDLRFSFWYNATSSLKLLHLHLIGFLLVHRMSKAFFYFFKSIVLWAVSNPRYIIFCNSNSIYILFGHWSRCVSNFLISFYHPCLVVFLYLICLGYFMSFSLFTFFLIKFYSSLSF